MQATYRLALVVVLLAAATPALAEYKGAVKPNSGLADFTKHDEAYYLSLDQIRIGSTEAEVTEQFGKKHKVSEFVGSDGKIHKTWRFASYRARMLSDPVDSIVTVEFVDGVVVGAKQVPAPGSDVQPAELKSATSSAPNSLADRLKALQDLLDQKLITPEEFETKRKSLIDGL